MYLVDRRVGVLPLRWREALYISNFLWGWLIIKGLRWRSICQSDLWRCDLDCKVFFRVCVFLCVRNGRPNKQLFCGAFLNLTTFSWSTEKSQCITVRTALFLPLSLTPSPTEFPSFFSFETGKEVFFLLIHKHGIERRIPFLVVFLLFFFFGFFSLWLVERKGENHTYLLSLSINFSIYLGSRQ